MPGWHFHPLHPPLKDTTQARETTLQNLAAFKEHFPGKVLKKARKDKIIGKM